MRPRGMLIFLLMTINPRQVSGRRKLRFETIADLEEETERLAAADVECLGNWSLGL